MSLRHQLPVASPLPGRAVVAALAGSARGADEAAAALDGAIRRWLPARDVLFTNSGTAALTLALLASQRPRPAPVALPAYVCYDLATAAAGADVRVVLYDLDPHTLQPDPASVRSALEAGAETVVVAHLFGMPVDLRLLREAFGGRDPLVVDDAAQGIGAAAGGVPAGAAGSVGVLSFGRGKGLTGGAGGALVALDERGVAVLAASRPRLGPAGAGAGPAIGLAGQWLLGRPTLYGLAAALPFLHLGETRYREPAPIRALPRAAARALGVTWPLVAEDVATRRRNALRLVHRLEDSRAFEALHPVPGAEPSYLRLPVLYEPAYRSAVVAARPLGVQPGYPEPLGSVAGLRGRCLEGTDCPGARTLADRLCTFPTHGLLRPDDLDRLERWVGRVDRAA